MKKALVLMANGFEEVEALSILDVLRRGGVDARSAAVGGDLVVHGAHGIDVGADMAFDGDTFRATDWDLVALPGGMGCMKTLRASEAVRQALREMEAAGRFVAAVCASPAVLGAAGLLEGRRFCCYPGIETDIVDGTYVKDASVVRDGRVITGTGPGTALDFALALLEALEGTTRRSEVAEAMLWGTGANARHRPIASTLAFILSPDKTQALLVHRTFRDDDENLGKYNGIGGKLEPDEDVVEGMRREIREETGLEVTSMTLRGTLTWADFGPHREQWLAFVFLVDGFTGDPPDRNEEGTLSWVPVADIPSLPLWKGDRLFLPLVFDGDERPFHGFMRYEGDEPVEWRWTR